MDDDKNIVLLDLNDRNVLITPEFIEVDQDIFIIQRLSGIEIFQNNDFDTVNDGYQRYITNNNFELNIIVIDSYCKIILGGHFSENIKIKITNSDVDIEKRNTFTSRSLSLNITESNYKIMATAPPDYE